MRNSIGKRDTAVGHKENQMISWGSPTGSVCGVNLYLIIRLISTSEFS